MDFLRGKKNAVRVRYDEIADVRKPPRKRNWKPFALTTPFLLSAVGFLLVSIIALEILVRKSVPIQSDKAEPTVHQNEARLLKAVPTKAPSWRSDTSAYIHIGPRIVKSTTLSWKSDQSAYVEIDNGPGVAPNTQLQADPTPVNTPAKQPPADPTPVNPTPANPPPSPDPTPVNTPNPPPQPEDTTSRSYYATLSGYLSIGDPNAAPSPFVQPPDPTPVNPTPGNPPQPDPTPANPPKQPDPTPGNPPQPDPTPDPTPVNPPNPDPTPGNPPKQPDPTPGNPPNPDPTPGNPPKQPDPTPGNPPNPDPTPANPPKQPDPTPGNPPNPDPTPGNPPKQPDPTPGNPPNPDPTPGNPPKQPDPTPGNPPNPDPTPAPKQPDPTPGNPPNPDPTPGNSPKPDPTPGNPPKADPTPGVPTPGNPTLTNPTPGNPTPPVPTPGIPTDQTQTEEEPTETFTPYTTEDAYLEIDTPTAVTPPPANPTDQTRTEESQLSFTPFTTEDAYLQIGTPTADTTGTYATNPSAYLSIGDSGSLTPSAPARETGTSATNPSAYLSINSLNSQTPSTYRNMVVSSGSTVTPGQTTSSGRTGSQISLSGQGSTTQTPQHQSSGDGTRTSTITGTSRDTESSYSVGTTVEKISFTSVMTSDGRLITSVIVATSTKTYTSTRPTETAILGVVADKMSHNMQVNDVFTKWSYFASMFLPSIIAVLIREIWYIIAAALKMMEPFYLMNSPDGATAKDSLMADYLGSTTSIYSLGRAFKGNTVMIIITLGNLIMCFLAPLAAETMSCLATMTYLNEGGTKVLRHPVWVLSIPLVRALQATLSLLAAMILLIAAFGRRRRSGLTANPSKITTMAALLNQPTAIQDIQTINPNASDERIEQAIAHNRYTITDYHDSYHNVRCGLVRVGEAVPQGLHRIPMEDMMAPTGGLSSYDKPEDRIKRTLGQMLYDGVFLFFAVGLLGTLAAYRIDASDSTFNQFFNSQKFGPRFILSLGASFVVSTFEGLEREVRLLVPFRRLVSRQASAKHTVLRAVNGTALSNLFGSIMYRSWFHLFIAFTTLLGDVLIIVIPGVPFNESLTFNAFQTRVFTSISICGLMLIAAVSIFVWRYNTQKKQIPQEPNGTLIRTWMMLSNKNNHLRALLDDVSHLKEGQVRARIRNDGGRYYAGWITDDYGRRMWCVDREPNHLQQDH